MNHLKIIQGTTLAEREDVAMSVIQKLYEIASGSTLDNTSDLQGRLHVAVGYRTPIEWLRANYPNLTIDVDDYAIDFEDENMLAYLLSIGVGSNGVITEAQAAAATVVANSQNTTVKKFNELKYFTQITGSNGSWEVAGYGKIQFYGWTALEEIDISNFTSIGHGGMFNVLDSFYGCTALKKVTASDKLIKLGRYVFKQCSNLEDIIGLSGTIMLESNVFDSCTKLKSSSFDNCTIMFYSGQGNYAFSGCSTITNITLDNSVTSIPEHCFDSCNSLSTINIPNSITSIGHYAFSGCSNLALDASNLGNVTFFGYQAFYGASIVGSLVLNANATFDAGGRVFTNSHLTSIDFSNTSLTDIPKETASSCQQLTTVTLPSSVTTIKNNAFIYCSALTSINLGNVTTIDASAFYQCTLLATLDLSNVTTIGERAFFRTYALTNVTSLASVTSISNSAFDSSGLSGAIVMPALTSIGNNVFSNAKITSIDFTGSTFTTIGNSALSNCKQLRKVIFPDTLTELQYSMFYGSNAIEYIKLPTPNTVTFGDYCFNSVPSTCILYVDDAKVSEVTAAVTSLAHGAFQGTVKGMSDFATDFPNG